MLPDPLMMLQGCQVEVVYEDVVYRGRLTGVDENDLYLVTELGSVTLPLSSISAVRAAA